LKILIVGLLEGMQNPGGGEIHARKLHEHLRKSGVAVDLFNPWEHKFSNYDLVIFWGSDAVLLSAAKSAKSSNPKVVAYPIYWSSFLASLFSDFPMSARIKLAFHDVMKNFFPFLGAFTRRFQLMHLFDALLVSSPTEGRLLAKHFLLDPSKCITVWNGVDSDFGDVGSSMFRKKYGLSQFVLTVGRIEPRKNQLRLIKALRKVDVPLVIIGDAMQGHERYYDACRESAGKNVRFLPFLANNSEMLRSAFAACVVFAMPSFFETPSIAALEAALCQVKVIITPYGTTRDFFHDYVTYVSPFSVSNIRNSVVSALDSPNDARLCTHIRENFTWEVLTDRIIQIFDHIISQ
jgi:glycosyltransferase involved in cell wall biosynthesis